MRPMAENRESMADLRRILSVRGPLYGAADIAVDTSGLSLGESFEALLRAARATAKTKAKPTASSAHSAPPEPNPPATTPPGSLAPQTAASVESAPGRVLESGPGYTIKAAEGAAAPTRVRGRATGFTNAAIERRHEPIVCQGARLLHIDNRNLVFDGDAVSAEDGCEIHITNSHISAGGVGISARAANVHIDNSLIEGDQASIDASEGAQVYAGSSQFRGLSRRLDSATFHDLGGNVWN